MNQMTVDTALEQSSLRASRDYLQDYRIRTDGLISSAFWENLCQLKGQAVADDDQMMAKTIWCLETIGRIQDHFVSAFLQIRIDEFKDAWDQLERCQVETGSLDRQFSDEGEEYGIEHARFHTKQFQELYPFEIGLSPGYLVKEARCSICHKELSLRGGCDHKRGEIYDGKMCGREITKLEVLHVSLTDKPANKFSVIFPNGNDDYRFSLVKSVVDALHSPWHRWRYRREERKDHHPRFKSVGLNDPCPCESGLRYENCCISKDTVFPHFEFFLEKGSPVEKQGFVGRPKESA